MQSKDIIKANLKINGRFTPPPMLWINVDLIVLP